MKYLLLFILLASPALYAQTEQSVTLPQVNVIGTVQEIEEIPGSAEIISSSDIRRAQPFTGNEVLRKATGLFVRDEEGLGLRPNISVRGIPGDRSRKLLILEDGAPTSLAPYGENASYYAPQIERVERIEVLKGSGSILYGPQTVGGVLNYITKPIPKTPSTGFALITGTNGYENLQLRSGGTWGQIGTETFLNYKNGDGPRTNMAFQIYDISQKFNLELTPDSTLGIKLQYYKERSGSTYLGLTTPLYEANDKFNPAPNDVFFVERIGLSANHKYTGFEGVDINTLFYAYTTKRDWWRQNYDRADNSSANTANDLLDKSGEAYTAVFGSGQNDGGSIFLRDSNGGRNRRYEVIGIEPRFNFKNFKTGLKAHYEFEDNKRINGDTPDSRSGVLDDDEQRSTLAFATWGLYEHSINDRWKVLPGIRIESFDQKRNVLVRNLNEINNSKSTGFTTVIIPGLGTTYDVNESLNLFAGIHRGFAPPRFSTAIDASLEDQQLEAEESWNYEAGLRTNLAKNTYFESTAFYYDYKNIIIDGSNSGQSNINGGEVSSYGIELSLKHRIFTKVGDSIGARFSGTLLTSKFQHDDLDGNHVPYTPNSFGSISFDFTKKEGHSIFVEGIFVGQMYTDQANTGTQSLDGELGRIHSHAVWNVTLSRQLSEKSSAFIAAKNIFDTKYIASRNPEGIFPGAEFQFNVGYRYNL